MSVDLSLWLHCSGGNPGGGAPRNLGVLGITCQLREWKVPVRLDMGKHFC